MTEQHELPYTFEYETITGDFTSVEGIITYEADEYYPEVRPSFNDPGAPAEGGTITIVSCTDEDGGEIKYDAQEEAQMLRYLYDQHDYAC